MNRPASDNLEILRRELSEPLPQPDVRQMRELAAPVVDWVIQHWQSLADQPVGATASRATMEALLREVPPELAQPFDQVLGEFQTKVAAYAFRVNHPRFLAFVPSSANFYSVLGDWLIAGANFFGGVWYEAAGPSQVELVVLDWFKAFLGYPSEAGGLLTGGGSEANLTALVVARERVPFADRQRTVLYVSEQRHWSVDRAAKVIGLTPDQLCLIQVDHAYRLRIDQFEKAIAADRAAGRLPWSVVVNAGATNTGAVDPLDELATVCQRERLWLHVDAAYGWPSVLIEEGRAGLAGIARADSIALDPHKWFAQTFEAGCLLVREGARLEETFAMRPDYMQDVVPGEEEVNFADRGIALTRRFRALKIWLSIKCQGVDWFRQLVRHSCRLAEYAQALLEQAPGFELLGTRSLSIVCFRALPPTASAGEHSSEETDDFNVTLLERLRATGRAFVSSTRLHGRVALRFCFVNGQTTAKDVEEIVALLEKLRSPQKD